MAMIGGQPTLCLPVASAPENLPPARLTSGRGRNGPVSACLYERAARARGQGDIKHHLGFTMPTPADFQDRMLSLGLARVSEAAALASAKLIGKGDELSLIHI